MNEKISEALNWRYAVKQFDPNKKVSEPDFRLILESARLAPSSSGIEPWKFLVIENPELRAQLKEISFNQSKVTDASHVVLITRRTDIAQPLAEERLQRTAATQHQAVEELGGLRKSVEGAITRHAAVGKYWAAAQTYIPLGFMLETAALLGIDTCPMEGFDNEKVDAFFNLPAQNLASVTMVAFGYRGEDPAATLPKVRRSFEEVVEFIK